MIFAQDIGMELPFPIRNEEVLNDKIRTDHE
jgi:hypothetical protein